MLFIFIHMSHSFHFPIVFSDTWILYLQYLTKRKTPHIGGDFLLVFTCSIQLSLLFHLFQCYLQLYGSWSNFFLILLSFYTICPDPGDGLLSCNATKVFQFDLLLSGFCQLPQ